MSAKVVIEQNAEGGWDVTSTDASRVIVSTQGENVYVSVGPDKGSPKPLDVQLA